LLVLLRGVELQFCQVPLLRMDGLKLVQSGAMVRHIARKAHLMGTTEQETTRSAAA